MEKAMYKILYVSIIVCLFACTSQHRATYLQAHPNLDPKFKEAITNKRIIPGMTTEMVEASWKPTGIKEFYQDEKTGNYFEAWYYTPAAYMRSRYGLPQSIYTIVFRNGIVIAQFHEYVPVTSIRIGGKIKTY